jgi:hypothetical protein
VESNLRLGPNVHSNADGDEIIKIEQIALEDEQVKAEIAKLQLPEGTVVISDPWIYGTLIFPLILLLFFCNNPTHVVIRIRWCQ